MTTERDSFIAKLVEELLPQAASRDDFQSCISLAKGKRWTVLLGAGISVAAGVPPASVLSRQLVEYLIRKSTLPELAFPELSDRLLFESAMQALSDHLGPDSVKEVIRQINTSQSTPGHYLVAEMIEHDVTPLILTTNFDCGLENTVRKRSGAVRLEETIGGVPCYAVSLGRATARFLKLHGDAGDPDTAIAAIWQYVRGYDSKVIDILRSSIENSLLLIVGYAAWDLDFLTLVRKADLTPEKIVWIDLRDEVGMRSVLSSGNRREKNAERRRLDLIETFRRRGVSVYVLGADFQEVSQTVLSEICSRDSCGTSEQRIDFHFLSRYDAEDINIILVDLAVRLCPDSTVAVPFEAILSRFTRPELCLRVRVLLGELLVRTGHYKEAARVLSSIGDGGVTDKYAAIGAFWLGRMHLEKGKWRRARMAFSRAVEIWPEDCEGGIRELTQNDLLFWTGDAGELRKIMTSAPTSAERFRLSIRTYAELRMYLEYLERVAGAFHFTGKPLDALGIDELYLEIGASAGDLSAYGRGLGNVGVCLLDLASVEPRRREVYLSEASEVLSQSVKELEEIDPVAAARMMGNLGECLIQRGSSSDGVGLVKTCISRLEHLGAAPLQVYFFALLAETCAGGRPVASVWFALRSIWLAFRYWEWGEGSRGIFSLAVVMNTVRLSCLAGTLAWIACRLARRYGNAHVVREVLKRFPKRDVSSPRLVA